LPALSYGDSLRVFRFSTDIRWTCMDEPPIVDGTSMFYNANTNILIAMQEALYEI